MSSSSGLISDIQRMSLHDGPGLRTTVFLKGCNLRCRWCHNPETFSSQPQLEMISDRCIQCGCCLPVCQTGALALNDEGRVAFNQKRCVSCFKCIDVCYPGALHKIGTLMTPEQLLKVIQADLDYFNESGGGVTFSGGEPMLQDDFLLAVLELLRAGNIHTAIETNLCVSWARYERLLPLLGLVIGDIKSLDDAAHQEWTGSSCRSVVDNIRKLDHIGHRFWLRTPVIPGFNDTEESIEAICSFASSLAHLERFELLPYHALGQYKYANLGIKCPMGEVPEMKKADLKKFDLVLERYHLL